MREELISWIKKNILFVPDHIAVMLTHAKPLEQQETHILQIVKDHTESWYTRNKPS